jgi:hypothetical protein
MAAETKFIDYPLQMIELKQCDISLDLLMRRDSNASSLQKNRKPP